MNSEYYTGWLDYWGGAHASTSAAQVARGLADMLRLGANVNMQVAGWGGGHSMGPGGCGGVWVGVGAERTRLVSRRYMFHGGTNFAYWSGEWGHSGAGVGGFPRRCSR